LINKGKNTIWSVIETNWSLSSYVLYYCYHYYCCYRWYYCYYCYYCNLPSITTFTPWKM